MNNQNILIYQNEQGNIKVDVKFEDESIWLTQTQICELYGKAQSTISEQLYLKMKNWMKKWLFGISEQPLNMEQ